MHWLNYLQTLLENAWSEIKPYSPPIVDMLQSGYCDWHEKQ